MTKHALILKKAEYLIGRELTRVEAKEIVQNVKVGNMKELKDAVDKFDRVRDFTDVGSIVEGSQIKDKTTKEELNSVIHDIAVKATSVDSGMKLLRASTGKSRESLMKYIMNLYLRDAMMKDKRRKTADGHRTILDGPASLTDNVSDTDPFVTPFHNPGQEDNSTTQVQDEYQQSGYTKNELETRPYHNEKKRNKKMKDQIRKYIENNIGKPTGGKEDSDSIGKT